MTRTLQKKFIVTSMIAVTVLLALLLGLLNGFNAWSNARRSERLAEVLLRTELIVGRAEEPPGNPPPEGELPPDGEQPPEGERPPNETREERELDTLMEHRGFLQEPLTEDDTRSAIFFTVRIAADGTAEADVSRTSVSEEDAVAMAQSLAAQGKSSGRQDSYRYSSQPLPDGGTFWVFLDTTGASRSVLRVALLSLLLGAAAWCLMLLLVILLSKKAIRPIAQNMEKQRNFVTDAGHELKTPLAIIQANAEALELCGGENKYTKNIREQVGRLGGLMQDLLTLARADGGQAALKLQPVDLSETAEQTLQSFQTPMELRSLRLEKEIAPALTVNGDRTLLTRLISILADNAVKYAAEGSTVRFRLYAADRTVCLQTSNRCPALPDCAPSKLFDRFYRADEARTQKSGGSGIGLSAAQAIAQAHRGRISAAYEGGDTVIFTVTLPVK